MNQIVFTLKERFWQQATALIDLDAAIG